MAENVRTVAHQVAEILKTPVPEFPTEIAEIVRLRSAARRIMEADLLVDDRDRLLVGLGPEIRRSRLPHWTLDAVLLEVSPPTFPHNFLPRGLVGRARILRRLGYQECPTCRKTVLTEIEETRDAARRREIERAEELWRRAAPLARSYS